MRSDYRSECRVRHPSRCAMTNWLAAFLTPGRNHGHVNRSAAELPRRGTIRNVEVQPAFAYGAPGIEDPVRSVVRRGSCNPNARSERQHCRIRRDHTFRDRDARGRNAAGAIRGRRKHEWASWSCRGLPCRSLRRRLRRCCLRWRHLRRRCLGRRSRMNSTGTRGNGHE